MQTKIKKSLSLVAILLSFAMMRCGKPNPPVNAERKDIVEAVFASGAIVYTNEYLVTANTEGFILQKNVKEGELVKQGELLFMLSNDIQNLQSVNALINYQEAVGNAEDNSPKIELLKNQIVQAKQTLMLDKRNYERYQEEIVTPKIQQISSQLTQARQALEMDKKNHERYETLIKTQAVSKVEYDKVKLQYENSLKNVEIIEKNLSEKQAATAMDLDKVKVQYENSQLNVAILEKNLSDIKNTLSQNVKKTKNQVDIQKEYSGDYSISSIMDGIVLSVFKETGELAKKGEPLSKIGAGTLIARLFISEEDITKIQLGQKTEMQLNTDKSKVYPATVSRIYPAFDTREQAFVIEATFTEIVPQLRPGTQTQANIVTGEKKNALIIPSKYLFAGDKVMLENKKQQPVQVGIRNAAWIEILGGIDEKTNLILPESK